MARQRLRLLMIILIGGVLAGGQTRRVHQRQRQGRLLVDAGRESEGGDL